MPPFSAESKVSLYEKSVTLIHIIEICVAIGAVPCFLAMERKGQT